MFDELLINTRFARWAISKILKKEMKKRAGIDGAVNLKKFVVKSDEQNVTIAVDATLTIKRADAERLLKQLLDEGS